MESNRRGDWVDRLSKSVQQHESSRRLSLGQIPRYEILERLGRGGMGAVYRAMDRVLSREVALKVLIDPLGAPAEARGRFLQEARLAATLQHPNIVPVFDAGEHEGQVFLAMQLIDGSGLEASGLGLREAVAAVRDAARAVQFAHDRGIIHRDLKPSNVMVDRAGRVYVTDFGLARRSDSAARMTLTGTIVGTPIYMPPEQARGKETDARSDTYSLGATLYELASGKPPFSGANELEILKHVLLDEPPFPRKHAPSLPPDLECVILKAMDKKPSGRYATAAALADDLDRWLRGEPVRAPVRGVLYTVRKRIVRHRWRVLAVATTIGFLLSSAAVAWPYLQAHRTWLKSEREDDPNERRRLLETAAPYSRRAQIALEKLQKAQKEKDKEDAQNTERERQKAIDDARRKALASQEIQDLTSAFWKAANALDLVHAEEKLTRLRQLNPTELDALEAGLRTAEFEQGIVTLSAQAEKFDTDGFGETIERLSAERYRSQRDQNSRLRKLALELAWRLDENRPGLRLSLLDRADKLGEKTARLFELRGLVHLKLRNLQKASEDYERFRKEAPEEPIPARYADLFVELASAARQPSEALSQLAKALDIKPNHPRALYERSIARYRAGGTARAALQDYQQLLELDPARKPAREHVDSAWNVLVDVAKRTWALEDRTVRQNEWTKAVEITEPVLSRAPGDPPGPLLELANMRRRLGDLSKALDDANRAADSAESFLVRGQILYLQANREPARLKESLENINKAVKAAPNSGSGWYWRGVVRQALDERDGKGDLKEAWRRDFRGAEFRIRLARFAALEASSDEVICLSSEALESPAPSEDEYLAMSVEHPGESPAQTTNRLRAEAHAYRGRGYLQKSDNPACVKECTAALGFDPDNWGGRYHRGLAKYNLADYDAAIADFSRLIELNDRDYKAYAARGSAYLKKNDREKAKDDYDKAIQCAPPKWEQLEDLKTNRKKL